MPEIGLELNVDKSEIIVFSSCEDGRTKVNGIKMVKQIKYLGITLSNKRNIMEDYVREKLDKSRNYECWMRYLLGGNHWEVNKDVHWRKSIWKGAISSSLMHGMAAIALKKKGLKRLEKVQNNIQYVVVFWRCQEERQKSI